MRKPVIAGNWKMYKLLSESVATALALRPLVANANHCEIVIAPVYTALKVVADRLEGSNIQIAAQNCSAEMNHGAHTGEVAADMLRDAGATLVIVGHSERRHLYGETDSLVQRKMQAALAAGLRVIMCVGETLEQREGGIAEQVVRGQLDGGLRGLTASDLERIMLAYEPVWAIGTGRTASPEQAQEMHAFVRRIFAERYSIEAAEGATDFVRRVGQARQCCGSDGATGCGRRARRRGEPRSRHLRAVGALRNLEDIRGRKLLLTYILYTLFITSCIVMILSVLLQPGKADAGALFTSSVSSTAFGPRGTQTLLAKITIIAAVVFMLTALTISFGVTETRSVLEGASQPTATPTPQASASPAATPEVNAPPVAPQTESNAPATSASPAATTAPATATPQGSPQQ